jgi:hypothetical protein
VDQVTKKGLKNLERTFRPEELAADTAAQSEQQNVKSEQIRYENADRIYE